MQFVEPYAGTAAVSLHIQGHRSPVSLSGSKARMAAAIVAHTQAMGAAAVTLCERDPHRRALLRCYTDDGLRAAVCDLLATWQESDAEVRWAEGRSINEPINSAQVALSVFSLVRTVGGAVKGGFKRLHTSKGTPVWNAWTPQQLAQRLRPVRLLHTTILDDATNAIPHADAIVYLDPPYLRGLGYQHTAPWRPIAHAWLSAGAAVYISEDHPVGRVSVPITMSRIGGGLSRPREEWLTRLCLEDLGTSLDITHPMGIG